MAVPSVENRIVYDDLFESWNGKLTDDQMILSNSGLSSDLFGNESNIEIVACSDKDSINDCCESPAVMDSVSHQACSEPGKRYRRLITGYLDYHFDKNTFWHDDHVPNHVDREVLIDYVVSFLNWYRNLTSSLISEINELGIFVEMEAEFVYKMCTEEGEGEQSKETAAQIRCKNPEMMEDPKEQITFNMYRSLEDAKDSHRNNLNICTRLLDKWHAVLLEGRKDAKPGIHRSSVSDQVGAFGHFFINGNEVEEALEYFIKKFNEMVQRSANDRISSNDVEHVVKWAAWSLLNLLSIHPYMDGNGRLSRLVCNYALSSIFPFDIPVYNVYNDFTSRTDYVKVLLKCRNCPCNDEDNQTECLKAKEIFDKANPGLLATMVLESCAYTCQYFYKKVNEKLQDRTPVFTASLPMYVERRGVQDARIGVLSQFIF